MFGHLCVVLDGFDVEPDAPDTSSTFGCALDAGTFVVFVGLVAALATAAPPNPSPKAPETTAAAMSGFFIRKRHLLLSARCCGQPRGGLPRWSFDSVKLELACVRRFALL
jgi:hypothetical protein